MVLGTGVLLGLAQLTKFSLLLFYPLWTVIWLAWIALSEVARPARKPGFSKKAGVLSPFRVLASGWLANRSGLIRRGAAQLVVMILTSVLVINLGYGFEGTGTRLGDYEFISGTLTRPRPLGLATGVDQSHPWASLLAKRQNRFRNTWLEALPVPLPKHYLAGFDEQKLESEGVEGQGYPVYLCGQLRRTGWWWYYLFALGVKVPLGTWLLTAVAVWVAWRGGAVPAGQRNPVFSEKPRFWSRARNWIRSKRLPDDSAQVPGASSNLRDELVLLAPPLALLMMMSLVTDIDLGLRYVLPGFPFWFVAISRVGSILTPRAKTGSASLVAAQRAAKDSSYVPVPIVSQPRSARWIAAIVALALLWNLAACRYHPHHLAYFNELVGGPDSGGRYLIDSNLDWGQDLVGLAQWLRENHPGESVGLAYFGNVDPSILSWDAEPLEFSLPPLRGLDDIILVAIGREGQLQELRQRRFEELLAEGFDPQTARSQVSLAGLWNESPTREQIIQLLDLRDGAQPGLYAISANFVFGLPFRLRDHDGNLWHARENAYGYFRKLEPVHRVGYSIFVYEVSLEQANRLRHETGLPPVERKPMPQRSTTAPKPPAELAAWLDAECLRLVVPVQ